MYVVINHDGTYAMAYIGNWFAQYRIFKNTFSAPAFGGSNATTSLAQGFTRYLLNLMLALSLASYIQKGTLNIYTTLMSSFLFDVC